MKLENKGKEAVRRDNLVTGVGIGSAVGKGIGVLDTAIAAALKLDR